MTKFEFDADRLIHASLPLLGLELGEASRAGCQAASGNGRASLARRAGVPARRRGGAGAGVYGVSLAAHLMSALEIRAAVVSGEASAREIVEATLERIEALNPKLGAFTDLTTKRALAKAAAIDARRARGETLGPLAGAPFGVKNLFDVAGLTTRAGSLINRDRAPPAPTRPWRRGSRRPARSWSARSTWANTPTTSPARTRTTGPRAIRITPGA